MPDDRQKFVAEKISLLVRYAKDKLNLQYLDAIYAENALLDLFRLLEPADPVEEFDGNIFRDILDPLAEYALEIGLSDELGKDRFKTRVMGLVTPSPSQVVDAFDKTAAKRGIRYATEDFYKFCYASTYLNKEKLDKNIKWDKLGPHGKLVITINVARPEKTPEEIAAAKAAPQTAYPKCMLCAENLGYAGRVNFPARQTLRYIPIPLSDDSLWYMQYSPYRYFDQHAIFFSEKHEPMALGEKSFLRMAELVEAIPHYFVGSNAPLPIVGGSILSHDHYQGGAKELPYFNTSVIRQFKNAKFPGVKFSIVDWYSSAIRLKGSDSESVCKAANYVNEMWANYNDEKCGIISHTGETLHNAITPVFRRERGDLYAELFLRNNRTDEAHPYGIFHPTEDMHHIKKEGIGLIEVMGLFVLPGRLAAIIKDLLRCVKREKPMKEYEERLKDESDTLYPYKDFLIQLITRYQTESNVAAINKQASEDIADYIYDTCVKIIGCTAVYKRTDEGMEGFVKFMKYLGCEEIIQEAQAPAEKPQFKKQFGRKGGARPFKKGNGNTNKENAAAETAQVEENSASEEKVEDSGAKKKGRPKKTVEEAPAAETPATEEKVEEAPNRRGRPKTKTAESVENKPEESETPAETPKRRGRPPKTK